VLYIEYARRKKGWTQLQLSQATRIVGSFISVTENGQGIPSAKQLDRLARALEIPADMLLKEVVTAIDLAAETTHEPASA
jgi:transcriptional regulator with XRE-family HTH domain